jgi:hypothetical protein
MDMSAGTRLNQGIDQRCQDCFLQTYLRLFDKFNISVQQQKEFLFFFRKSMASDTFGTTPEIQRELSEKFRLLSGINDLFALEKKESNSLAGMLYQEWKPKVLTSPDSFDMALRLAIAGNIMDYGAANSFDIHETIEHVLSVKFAIDKTKQLKQRISQAKSILYLGDNAGEIVFDKLFIEVLRHPDLTYVVRGGVTLNDATLEDAETVGMMSVANVITNGFDAPSTVLEKSSDEFLAYFQSADLIISKGQGNLEGLIHEKDSRCFFLLMVKCEVMAEFLNVDKGSIVVLN